MFTEVQGYVGIIRGKKWYANWLRDSKGVRGYDKKAKERMFQATLYRHEATGSMSIRTRQIAKQGDTRRSYRNWIEAGMAKVDNDNVWMKVAQAARMTRMVRRRWCAQTSKPALTQSLPTEHVR